MAPRDQEGLKAALRRRRPAHAADLRPAGAEQGRSRPSSARCPPLVAACPDLVYFVVGATHPAVLRQNGEAYRTTLEREAEQLGVREHVVFRDQYVTTEELCSYLQAADVFVSPYLNEAQVTSGALSYAMGAGAAVVSTPYWHAKELLADGRGRLFPFGDSAAPGRARSPRCSTIRRSWPACASRGVRVHARVHLAARSARQYLRLGATLARARTAQASSARGAARQQPARAAPRSPAAPDGRHRHHSARHLQRARPRERLLRRRQRPRAHRRAPRRSAERLARRRSGSSRRTSAFLHAAQTPDGPVPEPHDLRPRRSRTDAGVGGLHGPRALGAGHGGSPGARRGAAHAGAADVRARPARTRQSSVRAERR